MRARPKSTLFPSPSYIRNILTLRYDPEQKPIMHKLSWKDFTESKISDVDHNVERAMKSIIKDETEKLNHNKVAISLGSGVDSTTVLVLLRECYPHMDIHSISVGFNEPSDETKKAAQIAKMCDCEHHEVYIEDLFQDLPRQIGIVKEPRWNLYWYYIVKNAKSICDVLFTGDGGDELFGGYTFRYKKFLRLIKNKNTWKERAWIYLQCHARDWVPDQESLFGNKIKFSWTQILESLEPYFNNPLPPLGQVFLADFNGKLLFDYLPTNSKLHSFFKLHAVAPMLAKELISFATHIPYRLKYNMRANIGKLPLRHILKEKKFYNVSKGKQGFGPDVVSLWNRYGKDIAEYYLDKPRIVEDAWINQEWLESTFQKMKRETEVRYITKVFSLVAFEIWYRIFITKEMRNQAV